MKSRYPTYALFISVLCIPLAVSNAQNTAVQTDVNTPLHLLQPDYQIPYGNTTPEAIKATLDRVYVYLDSATPMTLVSLKTNEEITDYSKINNDVGFKKGDFRLISYEWGVTYAGMLNAGEATGDDKFTSYAVDRLSLLGILYPILKLKLIRRP